ADGGAARGAAPGDILRAAVDDCRTGNATGFHVLPTAEDLRADVDARDCLDATTLDHRVDGGAARENRRKVRQEGFVGAALDIERAGNDAADRRTPRQRERAAEQ